MTSTTDDVAAQLELLTKLAEGAVADRRQLLRALEQVQRVAEWMLKRDGTYPAARQRGISEILDICNTALRGLAVPQCFELRKGGEK